MSRAHNCRVSAALEAAVDAPADDLVVIVTADRITWSLVDPEPDVAWRLTVALVAALDDGYTTFGPHHVTGRIQGVPFTCSTVARQAAPAHPSLGGRHLAVVR
jgi:hypothetical protein